VYYFGVLDCYTLLQDFYRRDLSITLPDFDREGFKAGEPLYRRHMQEAGFELVADGCCLEERLLQRGDVLLLRVQSQDVDNHVAVYLGDGHMLHHLHGQLSRRDRFDHPWQRRCFGVARHKLMMGKPWSGPQ
jgi:cell wall-associated NlpC family hydrolase